MPNEWTATATAYLNDTFSKIRSTPVPGTKVETPHGVVTFVAELEHQECPVFGKVLRDVLPFQITVATKPGRHRAALALVHELLHAADYSVRQTTNHTLLHNIAALIESEVLQKMKGYHAP